MLKGHIILHLLCVDQAKEEICCKVENQSETREVGHRFNAVLDSLNEQDNNPDWLKNTNENNKVGYDLAFSIADLAHDWHDHQE